MKTTKIIYVLTLSTILISCNTKQKNSETELSNDEKPVTEKKIETSTKEDSLKIKGDYNGDGIFEYASVKAPKQIENDACECESGECIAYIVFSDTKIPQIKISGDIGGYLENVGDLNEDGKDELLYQQGWCTSSWKTWTLWTLKTNKWIYAIEPFEIRGDIEENEKIVTKDLNKKGNVIVKYSSQKDENTGEILSKSVPIQ